MQSVADLAGPTAATLITGSSENRRPRNFESESVRLGYDRIAVTEPKVLDTFPTLSPIRDLS